MLVKPGLEPGFFVFENAWRESLLGERAQQLATTDFLAMTWTGADRNLLAAKGIFDNSRLPTCITFRRGVSHCLATDLPVCMNDKRTVLAVSGRGAGHGVANSRILVTCCGGRICAARSAGSSVRL